MESSLQKTVIDQNNINTQRTARYTLFLLTLVYTFNIVDRFILGILLPQIKQEMVLNDSLLGLLTGAAFAIFYATLGMPIARLSERYSRKTIIAICLAFFSAMTALCGLATNFLWLFIARIGVGIGEAGTMPAAASITSDLYPKEKRSSAMAIMSVGANIGLLISFIVGGYVAAQYGWRSAFMVIGLPGTILALIIFFTMDEPKRGSADNFKIGANQDAPAFAQCVHFLYTQKSFLRMNACFALMVGASTGALAWVPSFLNRSHGLEVSQVGLALGLIIGIGGIFGTVVIGGFLSDRLVKRDLRWGLWIGAVGAALMAVGYILMISASSGNGALIAFLIPGILGIFFQGPLMALIQAVSPVKMRATSVAISLFITNLLGLGLGPLIIGTLSDLLSPTYGDASLQMALLAIPVTLVISIFAFIAAARPLIEDIKRAEAY